jgi:hypothetical protein
MPDLLRPWTLLLLLCAMQAAEPTAQPIDVLLCIGQSNMAGRARFDATANPPQEGCLLLNDDPDICPAGPF